MRTGFGRRASGVGHSASDDTGVGHVPRPTPSLSKVESPTPAVRRPTPAIAAYAAIADVQFGHFVAASGIDVAQYGHVFVFAGGGAGFLYSFDTARTSRNTASAMIRNVMMLLIDRKSTRLNSSH